MGKKWDKSKFSTFLQEEGAWYAGMEAAPPDELCPVMLEMKNKGTNCCGEDLQP